MAEHPLDRDANAGATVARGRVFLLEFRVASDDVSKAYAVTAHDAASGRLLWETPVGSGQLVSFSMLAVAYGTLFVVVPDGTLRALDSATGSQRWSIPLKPTDSSPAVANGLVYIAAGARIYAFDAAKGTRRWMRPLEAVAMSSPVVTSGSVYVGDEAGVVHAFRLP